jgi:hypothetical protein
MPGHEALFFRTHHVWRPTRRDAVGVAYLLVVCANLYRTPPLEGTRLKACFNVIDSAVAKGLVSRRRVASVKRNVGSSRRSMLKANLIRERKRMKLPTLMRITTMLVLLCTGPSILSGEVCAQAIDFSQIDAFESMGTGTLHGASPPKTVVDDDERHTVVLTIWESDTDTKVYWKSLDGNLPRTSIIPGPAVQTFQTAGAFRLEALGDENRSVKYGYLLLRLNKK